MSGIDISIMMFFSPADAFLAIKKDRNDFRRITPTVILLWCLFCNTAKLFIVNYPLSAVNIEDINLFQQIFSFLLPILLWVFGSFYVTCIFNGESMFREVYAATCYAFLPYAVFTLPLALFTNVLGIGGLSLYHNLTMIVNLWVVILILTGLSVMNNYSFGKVILVALVSIFAMLFIAVIFVLLYVLGVKLFDFISELIKEYKLFIFG